MGSAIMSIFNWKYFCAGRSEIGKLYGKLKELFCARARDASTLNEVLFYGAEDEEQRRRVGLNNLFCIYYILLHANDSIDICAPSLASDTIIKSLINVKQKGDIKIRIAIYNSVDYDTLRTFGKYGIEVKSVSSAVQLEHEFILIDASDCADAVAIMGSVDYEINRVNVNRDTTIITSELAVTTTLKREFDRVWSSIPDILK